jgi:hypothetical protein
MLKERAMMSTRPILFCIVFLLLFTSCSGPRKLTELLFPEKLDSSFRSGIVNHLATGKNKFAVFEYRAFYDSLVNGFNKDSVLTSGIIFPASVLSGYAMEAKMLFGTDSLQYNIWYINLYIYKKTTEHSLLSDIILNPRKNDPAYDPYQSKTTHYKRLMDATVQSPLLKEDVIFHFEQARPGNEYNFDSSSITGYIKTPEDSFFVKSLFKEIPLHGKNVKPMQILQGYSLIKGEELLAFLQHSPMTKDLFRSGLKDMLYIHPKATATEQALVAAYFTLVCRLVASSAMEPFY